MLYEGDALLEVRTRGAVSKALGRLQMQCDARQHLSKLVVERTAQTSHRRRKRGARATFGARLTVTGNAY
jgi:hypothetical protein